MESHNHKNDEDERIARITKGKPPTRLQKRAPAALQLGDISCSDDNVCALVKRESFSRCAIPLLSPLALSPNPILMSEPESMSSTHTDVQNGKNQNSGASLGSGGWQHPAVTGTSPEASSMFDLFQMQCTLVQHSQ